MVDESDSELELTADQKAALHERLLERRGEVHREIVAAKEDAAPVGLDLAIGRLTRVDAMQQQQMAAARGRRLQRQLDQIQGALARIRVGHYGACARCEGDIPYARLWARPEAPLCLACQEGSQV